MWGLFVFVCFPSSLYYSDFEPDYGQVSNRKVLYFSHSIDYLTVSMVVLLPEIFLKLSFHSILMDSVK